MKKLITYLYIRYCKPEIKTLYLGGLQRDFSKELTDVEERQRNQACINFKEASEWIFNEILKEHSEVFFALETEEARTHLQRAINTILRVEEKIKSYAYIEKKPTINKYEPL